LDSKEKKYQEQENKGKNKENQAGQGNPKISGPNRPSI
jgi:hypothetical protein